MPTKEYEEPRPAEVTGSYGLLVCKNLQFHTDSAVVLPDGLMAISEALAHARDFPKERLLVLSHTDAVDPDNNQELSRQRAKSVLHLLGGKAGGKTTNMIPWADVRKRSVTRDVQVILQWAAGLGWPRCQPLGPGEALLQDTGPQKKAPLPLDSKRAMYWFLAHYRATYKTPPAPMPAQLPTDGSVEALAADNAEFWRAVFHLYWIRIGTLLGILDGDELTKLTNAVNYLRDGDARSVGCGDKYMLEKTSGSCQKNRRTEFLFFPEDGAAPDEKRFGDLYDATKFARTDIPCMEKPPERKRGGIKIDTSSADTVFVLDCSGSMSAKDPGQTEDRFARCKAALTAAIEELGEATALGARRRFNIVEFSNKGKAYVPAADDKAGGPRALPLLPATASNVAAATKHVGGLPHSGATNTYDALELAFGVRVSKEVLDDVRIVVLSDGKPECPGDTITSPPAILTAVARWRKNPKWKVDAFGFKHGDGGGAFTQFMKDLAAQNGGRFTEI